MLASAKRLALSVGSLSANSIDPAHILELTDRLNMLSVNSPLHPMNQRQSPGFRQQNPTTKSRDTSANQPLRLQGTGRIGSFPAPSAYQHQQAPRRSNIPPPPPLPFIQPSIGRQTVPPLLLPHICLIHLIAPLLNSWDSIRSLLGENRSPYDIYCLQGSLRS